jgi:hypothetical protein
MLFAAQDGRPEHPIEDSTEVGVVQRIACGLGPNVDGMTAARALPQAMGAFITYGAQGACAGRDQQAEQHSPTTMHLGQTMSVAPSSSTPAPTTGTTTLSPTTASKLLALRSSISPLFTTGTKPVATTGPAPDTSTPTAPTPTAPTPGTPDAAAAAPVHPPGTITAFSSKLNMWRVAFPIAAATPTGLGIFSAPATFVEQAPQAAPSSGDTQVPEKELEAKTGQLPFFKKPLFWIIVASSVVVLGGGATFLVMRRRKKAAPAPAALPKAAYY